VRRPTALPMSGRTVLVTGATGGIGRATARGLASLGARVGIVGRDPDRAVAAANAIRQGSPAACVDVFVADLSSQGEVRRLATEVLATRTYFAERRPKQSSPLSRDRGVAGRLWQVSSDLVAQTPAG